jgi:tRNA (guanine10-N2)-dimethyltransferase
MRQSPSPPTSGPSRNRILFLLSGEDGEIPAAEVHALVETQDNSATFSRPHSRVIIAATDLNPAGLEKRIAYSRRVGRILPDERIDRSTLADLRKGTYAIRVFELTERRDSIEVVSGLADQVDGRVSLDNPDRELTLVRAESDYLALTNPAQMRQSWAKRRPRARPFFHPAAIFPKFARLLVNLSGVLPGEIFLDPFCGTGSLLLEANEVGASPVGIDISSKMTRGSRSNAEGFGQYWLGVLKSDSNHFPLSRVDAIATDIPYGRVSSTSGSTSASILENLIKESATVLPVGRRLVVMHPQTLAIGIVSGFETLGELHLPVHRKLTRTISVMRRT